MATYRRPRTNELREMAELVASTTYGRVNTAFVDFVRELGGFASLPKQLDIDSPAMKAAEQEIDDTAASGDISKTHDLCRAYEDRFNKYLDAWRAKLRKMNSTEQEAA